MVEAKAGTCLCVYSVKLFRWFEEIFLETWQRRLPKTTSMNHDYKAKIRKKEEWKIN